MQLTDGKTAPRAYTLPLALFPSRFSLEAWENDPEGCCRDWLGDEGFSAESARVYLSMWAKFSRWRKSRRIPLISVSDLDLARFLDAIGLEKHHRYRYLRLIERIYAHLATLRHGLANPASLAARKRVGEGENAPTASLDKDQRDTLIEYMEQHYSGQGIPAVGRNTHWRIRRDFALVAVMLGAGLKVSEARIASVNCIFQQDCSKIDVIDDAKGWHHQAHVLPFARPILRDWMAYRRQSGVAGERLFPSSDKGETLDPTSLWRRANKLIGMSGVRLPGREAPTTLRNTYAAILFDLGEPDETVAECLGLAEVGSASRLRMAIA